MKILTLALRNSNLDLIQKWDFPVALLQCNPLQRSRILQILPPESPLRDAIVSTAWRYV